MTDYPATAAISHSTTDCAIAENDQGLDRTLIKNLRLLEKLAPKLLISKQNRKRGILSHSCDHTNKILHVNL